MKNGITALKEGPEKAFSLGKKNSCQSLRFGCRYKLSETHYLNNFLPCAKSVDFANHILKTFAIKCLTVDLGTLKSKGKLGQFHESLISLKMQRIMTFFKKKNLTFLTCLTIMPPIDLSRSLFNPKECFLGNPRVENVGYVF